MTATAHPLRAEQIREHRRLKRANRRLAARLAKTITPRALDGTLAALALRDDGEILRGEGALVLADCCLHEWRQDGRTLIQRFAESTDARRLTGDERRLLELWRGARLALLRVDEVWPGHGLRVHDALEGRDLALLDPVLNRPLLRGFWIIARVFSPGGYWMTTPSVTLMGPLGESVLDRMRAGLGAMRAQGDPRVPLVLATLALTVHSTLARQEEEGRGEEEGTPYDGDRIPDEELLEAALGDARRRPPDPPDATTPARAAAAGNTRSAARSCRGLRRAAASENPPRRRGPVGPPPAARTRSTRSARSGSAGSSTLRPSMCRRRDARPRAASRGGWEPIRALNERGMDV